MQIKRSVRCDVHMARSKKKYSTLSHLVIVIRRDGAMRVESWAVLCCAACIMQLLVFLSFSCHYCCCFYCSCHDFFCTSSSTEASSSSSGAINYKCWVYKYTTLSTQTCLYMFIISAIVDRQFSGLIIQRRPLTVGVFDSQLCVKLVPFTFFKQANKTKSNNYLFKLL